MSIVVIPFLALTAVIPRSSRLGGTVSVKKRKKEDYLAVLKAVKTYRYNNPKTT